jgi:hypothetical protein
MCFACRHCTAENSVCTPAEAISACKHEGAHVKLLHVLHLRSSPYCCEMPVSCSSGSFAAMLSGCFCWLHSDPSNGRVRGAVTSSQ